MPAAAFCCLLASKPKLSNVVGKADTEHLKPDLPKDPQNRRISIIFTARVIDQTRDCCKAASGGTGSVPVDPGYRKTTGNVQFP